MTKVDIIQGIITASHPLPPHLSEKLTSCPSEKTVLGENKSWKPVINLSVLSGGGTLLHKGIKKKHGKDDMQ